MNAWMIEVPRATIQPRIHDIPRYVNLARSNGFSFELIEPAYPQNLDILDEYFSDFLRVESAVGLVKVIHGPYIDIAVHSADKAVRNVSARRISASIEWAKRLDAEYLVLHSNHLPMLNEPGYDRQWRNGWLSFLEGQDLGSVTVLLEVVSEKLLSEQMGSTNPRFNRGPRWKVARLIVDHCSPDGRWILVLARVAGLWARANDTARPPGYHGPVFPAATALAPLMHLEALTEDFPRASQSSRRCPYHRDREGLLNLIE